MLGLKFVSPKPVLMSSGMITKSKTIIYPGTPWRLSEERPSWTTGPSGGTLKNLNGSIALFVGAKPWSCSYWTYGSIGIRNAGPCSVKHRRSGCLNKSRGHERSLSSSRRRCRWRAVAGTVGKVMPTERTEILRYLQQKKISGVVFLSADLHCAAITRIPKGNGLKNITAGPLAAPLNRITNGTTRRYEFFSAENFNFAKITVDPKAQPVHALVEFIDQDNRLFHSTKIMSA